MMSASGLGKSNTSCLRIADIDVRYGADAGQNTHLATHTAKNVVLVYVDMTGFARKALIKKAGKEWIKARVGGKSDRPVPPPPSSPRPSSSGKK